MASNLLSSQNGKLAESDRNAELRYTAGTRTHSGLLQCPGLSTKFLQNKER